MTTQTATPETTVPPAPEEPARCIAILEAGVKKSADMKTAMSALMSDLASGRMTAGTGNAICNAAGKILKTVELEQRYGKKNDDGAKSIAITSEPS